MAQDAVSLGSVIAMRLMTTHVVLADALPRIAAGEGGEAIHRARVAMRHARVALRLIPRKHRLADCAQLSAALGHLARAIGGARTCEIFAADLALRSAELAKADRALLSQRLAADHAAALRQARRGAAAGAAKVLVALESVARRCRSDLTDPALHRLGRLCARRLKRNLKGLAILDAQGDPEQFHDLRKSFKTLRYLLDLVPPPARRRKWFRPLYRSVQNLQDQLGHLQDLSEWAQRLDQWSNVKRPAHLSAASVMLAGRVRVERDAMMVALSQADCPASRGLQKSAALDKLQALRHEI